MRKREEHRHLNMNMGDPTSRRNQTRNRLRAQLRKKRESLADQFDFKIYIAFVFKEKVCIVTFSFRFVVIHIHLLPEMFCCRAGCSKFVLLVPTEKEVCTFRSCRSGASDDQQLRRKHPARCQRFQLLTREFHRTPAKRCCATTRAALPVDAKGE